MLFIQYAFEEPLFYFSWILTVVVSIILHELAHGWAAIWQGDDTPQIHKRLTPDPMVHMGPYSLIMLFLIGIAWGQMPVNPSRFRSRYGETFVSAAGPAMNVLLALLMLTAMAVMIRFNLFSADPLGENLEMFMRVFGMANLALALFNLIPLPPLDGSHILANLNESYSRFVSDPDKQGTLGIIFLLVFIFFGGILFTAAINISHAYVGWLLDVMGYDPLGNLLLNL